MSRSAYVTSLLALSAATLFLGLARRSTAGAGEGGVFDEEVVRRVRSIILRHYVEDLEDLDRKLYYGALGGMADVLDRHSQFLTPEQREELRIDTRGRFGGLGIVIEKPLGKLGPIIVITPFLGTPASKAGIQPGDRIVEIEGESTIGMDLMEAVHKLRGEPGTEVKTKIQRPPRDMTGAISAGRVLMGSRLVSIDGSPVAGLKESDIVDLLDAKRGRRVSITVVPETLSKPREVVIERANITVPAVEFARLADPDAKIGYVRLARFQEDSARELREAVGDLLARGMRALVLDLRGNPGGLLSAAIKVSELFLGKGKDIVSTKARGRTDGRRYRARFAGPYSEDLPMVILVDKYTASAAEIVSAAVRDNGRGIIVGGRTFGKGSVQKPFDIRLGWDPEEESELIGSLKLTVEKYYTPGGTSLQREPEKEVWGVEPHIVLEEMTGAEKADLRRQWEQDRAAEQKGEKIETDEAERAPDRHLERGMEILRAVLVLTSPLETKAAAD